MNEDFMAMIFIGGASTTMVVSGHPSTMPSARGNGDAAGSGSKRGTPEQVNKVMAEPSTSNRT